MAIIANIKKFLQKFPRLCSLSLGALTAAALPPYCFIPCLIIGLSGLVILIELSKSSQQAFGIGYWFGFTHFAVGFSWIIHALLIDPERLGWLIPFVFILSGGFFGLFIAIPCFFSFFFRKPLAKIFALSTAWTLCEWLRSFIFTGFPWNLLGTIWIFSDSAIQAASIFGTYGLSLFTVLFASAPCVFFFFPKKKDIIISISIIVFIPLFLFTYGWHRLQKYSNDSFSNIQIRIVQPSIPQQLKWQKESLTANLQTYINMSKKPTDKPLSAVIWGETANPFALNFEPEYFDVLKPAIPEDGYLITGTLDYVYDGEKWRPINAMQVLDQNGIYTSYGKSHLVPFGEYIPFRNYLPDKLKPVTNVIADFMPGNGIETFYIPKIPPFSVAICYEIIFPGAVTDHKNRPEWLINLTNDGWYGDSSGPQQHFAATRMRAVEEGITIVRAANSGISGLISKTGVVIDMLSYNQKGILDFYLPQELHTQTLYTKYYNLTIILLCMLFIITAYFSSRHIE